MARLQTTHREVLRGMMIAAPLAALLICSVWFVGIGKSPSRIVWQLAAIVFGVYLALAAVAWINSRIARREKASKSSG